MALKQIFRTNQNANYNTLNFAATTININSGSSGNISFSSLFYTVPTGKTAKVIINDLYFVLYNQAPMAGNSYSQAASLVISNSFIYQESFVQKALLNIGPVFNISYNSSASVSANIFSMFSLYDRNIYLWSIPGYGMNYNTIENYLNPINNSTMRGKWSSITAEQPLSGQYAFFGSSANVGNLKVPNLVPFFNAGGPAYIADFNTYKFDSAHVNRVQTLKAGESVAIDVSFSFLWSVSMGATALSTGHFSVANQKRVYVNFDVLVLEDNA